MRMIAWLLLLSLFGKYTQDGQENGVLCCGPQNVTLAHNDQTLLLKWEDDPSCSVIRDGLVYELQLLIADKPEHNGEVVVAPAQIGSTHSWKWTSHLPSQCARHSVRLRSQYNNQSSPWMQKTLPDDPEATSLTAKNLNISMYTFTVTASTAFGLCGNSSINVTLNPPTDQLIMLILISLGAVFLILSVSTIICYRHWACIKHKVCPPIPKPVLTEWLTDEHTVRHLHFDQRHYREVWDVPELHDYFSAPQPVVGQDYMPSFSFSQTPKGYYNKLLKKLQPPLTLPTTGLTSQPGVLSFPGNDVFPNPSYNLRVQGEDQQSQSHLQIQQGICIIDSFHEYQPQSPEETFTATHPEDVPDSPLSYSFTYILLPQKTSKQLLHV
ncbi:uncharacterized protein LOC113026112 [Astatotilapia calliptera]|uniref:uncharacterized protein LOC113026112 n=1 Tax=Astatotilapia calliptera TaxID=8154 RepID=UPI000E40C49D|nr:uncharacterized protein LOC113026112 [Astatotilapia calliptera]